MQVVALNALAHLSKSEAGGGVGESYTLGVVAALCENEDADVRGAAVKAMGSICKGMDAHYTDRLRPRLQDSDWSVREHAVRTLTRIGAWGGNDALAAALLQCAASDSHAAVQRAAADALVAVLSGEQAASARAVIKRVLQHKTLDPRRLPQLVVVLLE